MQPVMRRASMWCRESPRRPPSGIAATRVDELIWPRDEPGPAFELPIAEVIDFLVELGRNLDHRLNPHLSEAMASLAVNHPLGPRYSSTTSLDYPPSSTEACWSSSSNSAGSGAWRWVAPDCRSSGRLAP